MTRARLVRDFLTPGRTHRYGDVSSAQQAELHLPRGRGPHPVVVLIHGGSWSAGIRKPVMRALARDLVRRGHAAWNIEYRRLGRGGGWPMTFADVAAAIDRLAQLDAPLDLGRVTLYGHSAGGHLALWAASRGHLPEGAPGHAPLVHPLAAVSAAGVCDLAQTYREAPGGVVGMLMGGGPDDVPDRYAAGDPIALVPLAIPVLLVHGTADATVSVRRSRNYAQAARTAGASVELVEIPGEAGAHRSHVFPSSASWTAIASWLERERERDSRPSRAQEPDRAAAGGPGEGGQPARGD
jgi:acetyl esterase/lipase